MAQELLVYGTISQFAIGASLAGTVAALNGLDPGETLLVRIHSPGGDPFEAAAMKARLEASDHPVEIVIDGMAASAASLLAATRNARVTMAPDAMIMIHNAKSGAAGEARTLEAAARMLRGLNAMAADAYASRTGLEVDRIKSMMSAETWLRADRAVELGFADAIGAVASEEPAELGDVRFSVDVFMEAPPEAARMAAGNLHPFKASCKAPGMQFGKEVRARLKLAEDASDEEVLAALDRAAQAPAPAPAAGPAPAVVMSASEVEALIQRHLAALPAPAEEPDPIAEAHALAASAVVDRFIASGKIAPKDRENAIKMCGKTSAQLSTVAAYWEGQPTLIAAPLATGDAPGTKRTLTKRQKQMARSAGLTEAQMLAEIEREAEEAAE